MKRGVTALIYILFHEASIKPICFDTDGKNVSVFKTSAPPLCCVGRSLTNFAKIHFFHL